jgi:hypothetical protein
VMQFALNDLPNLFGSWALQTLGETQDDHRIASSPMPVSKSIRVPPTRGPG